MLDCLAADNKIATGRKHGSCGGVHEVREVARRCNGGKARGGAARERDGPRRRGVRGEWRRMRDGSWADCMCPCQRFTRHVTMTAAWLRAGTRSSGCRRKIVLTPFSSLAEARYLTDPGPTGRAAGPFPFWCRTRVIGFSLTLAPGFS